VQTELPTDAARHLKRKLLLTRLGMGLEAFLRAFWPLLTLLMLTGAALLSGLVAWLPARIGLGLLAALGAGALATLALGLWRFRWPRLAAAATRIDAHLPGQPLAALTDRQAIGAEDPASRSVWQAHRARMAARLSGARAIPPHPDLAPRDPYALRLMAAVALVMALGFGVGLRLDDPAALLPKGGAEAALAPASWEGWITPPAYTGKPTLYLGDQPAGTLVVPKGSRISLRFYGRAGDIGLRQDVTRAATKPGEEHGEEPATSFTVDQDGTLAITGPGATSWDVVAAADLPPMIAPAGEVSRTLAGDFEQGFTASDDYGVAAASGVIDLDLSQITRRYGLAPDPEPRAAIRVDLPMPYRGDRAEIAETMVANFAGHPWAGMPVTLVLEAIDELGQTGHSQPLQIILPGRRFLDPLAMALIEQRRDLLWNRTNAPRVARLLRAVSNHPDGFFRREVTYLMLRTAARTLESEQPLSAATRDRVAQDLWDIALSLDETNLDDAKERLRQAQERLSEAMRQGASQEELSQLMDELREAMRDYTDQLAQQAPQPDNQAGVDQPDQGQQPPGQEFSQQDLEAMMDAIEQAMKEGRQDEAQAMLEQLQELMENMQAAESRPGEGDGDGGEAMQGLADSLTQQQGLSDEAFRDLQEQGNPSAQAGESDQNVGRNGGRGQGQSHDGQGGQGDGEGAQGDPGGDLSQRQQGLADALDEQRRNLPGAGSDGGDAAREALNQAERAMRDAANGLSDGDLSGALDKQAEAMEALREGMRQLDRALAEAQQNRSGQQGAQGNPGNARPNDPLGRGPNSRGGLTTDAPYQDGQDVYRRAEELMQELRRRAGESQRPAPERDYLRRLLDRF